jgi:hypothetical protein
MFFLNAQIWLHCLYGQSLQNAQNLFVSSAKNDGKLLTKVRTEAVTLEHMGCYSRDAATCNTLQQPLRKVFSNSHRQTPVRSTDIDCSTVT